MSDGTCSIAGCGNRRRTRGWCDMHYMRWLRHSDPLFVVRPKAPRRPVTIKNPRVVDAETRFLSKAVRLPSGCWQWTGSRKGEYGSFTVNGADVLAHRWAYEHWTGPVPAGRHMDHYRFPQDGCIGPACVNPEHLRPVSPRENVLRSDSVGSRAAAKTHCPQGHPYAGENLYINPRGSRICRTCKRGRRS